MPKNLTASDRKSLIRLASALPAGSPERRAILSGLTQTAGRIRGADPDTVDLLGLAIKSAMPYSDDDNRKGTSRYRKFVDQVSRILSKVDRDTASRSIRQVMSNHSILPQNAMALPLILGFGKAFNTDDMPF